MQMHIMYVYYRREGVVLEKIDIFDIIFEQKA